MEQSARERQPELKEVHYKLQEQGKRLDDCLNRLTAIGNRLFDQSMVLQSKSHVPEGESKGKETVPGLVHDLHVTAEGYDIIITRVQDALTKIEKFI